MDDTVIMGGALFGFLGIPNALYHTTHGVRGVVNLCEEYRGPVRQYQKLGMVKCHHGVEYDFSTCQQENAFSS